MNENNEDINLEDKQNKTIKKKKIWRRFGKIWGRFGRRIWGRRIWKNNEGDYEQILKDDLEKIYQVIDDIKNHRVNKENLSNIFE